MDLKLKIIGYDVSQTAPIEVQNVVNEFMSQVNVKDVQVVTVLSNVILHIFYEGDEPEYGNAEGQ